MIRTRGRTHRCNRPETLPWGEAHLIFRGKWRLRLALISVLVFWMGTARAQTSAVPADTLDPLLSRVASWVDANPARAYGYAALASGAALSIGCSADSGYHLPVSLKLLWPANLILVADSNYVAIQPHSVSSAQKEILSVLHNGGAVLLLASQPVYVYGADSSLGEPWFFAATGGPLNADSALWDAADFKRNWWLWCDEPGANTIWTRPKSAKAPRGRRAVEDGIRHSVLAARPCPGRLPTGLAAYDVVPRTPGNSSELLRLSVIRKAAARFLQDELELWPPAEREPLKLAVYHLEKSAEAFRELAMRTADWQLTSDVRRDELISAVSSHETGAAVALDGLVSPRQ